MKRFIEGADRSQTTLFPSSLEDYISEDNPVRVIDVFVDELDLRVLGFGGVDPAETGRPAGRLRLNTSKAKLAQIKLIDKDINHPNRIVFNDVIVQPFREQRALVAVLNPYDGHTLTATAARAEAMTGGEDQAHLCRGQYCSAMGR